MSRRVPSDGLLVNIHAGNQMSTGKNRQTGRTYPWNRLIAGFRCRGCSTLLVILIRLRGACTARCAELGTLGWLVGSGVSSLVGVIRSFSHCSLSSLAIITNWLGILLWRCQYIGLLVFLFFHGNVADGINIRLVTWKQLSWRENNYRDVEQL